MNKFQKFWHKRRCSHIWGNVGEIKKLRTVKERDDFSCSNLHIYSTYTYYQQKQTCPKCNKSRVEEIRELHV